MVEIPTGALYVYYCVFIPGKRYIAREEPSLSADAVARSPVEWSSNRKPSFGGECSTRKISMYPEAPASIDRIIRHIFITAAQEHYIAGKHNSNN